MSSPSLICPHKVALLCFQYFNDVKKARDDISRLRREVANLEHASKSIQQLINGPHHAKLEAFQQLSIAIQDCQLRLTSYMTNFDQKKSVRQSHGLDLKP